MSMENRFRTGSRALPRDDHRKMDDHHRVFRGRGWKTISTWSNSEYRMDSHLLRLHLIYQPRPNSSPPTELRPGDLDRSQRPPMLRPQDQPHSKKRDKWE